MHPANVLPQPSETAGPAPTVPPPTRIAQLGLGDVLAFAGADNWAVQLANERVREAQAQFDAARVLWLPSLNAGIGYTKHDGQIQDTQGQVIDVNRGSLFVGGGAVTANAPTAAGSGGPARMFIDLSLADAIFLPRFAEDLLSSREWSRQVTFNNTLLEAALAYYEVVRTQQQLALARENLQLTETLLKETKRFAESGKGTTADVSRVEVQVERRKQDLVLADFALQAAAAELARILRINLSTAKGSVAIYAQDAQLVPVDFVSASSDLNELTAQAIAGRPEMSERSALVEAARQRALTEHWRPWIPNLHAGLSTGGFGGGTGGTIDNFDDRVDFDVLAIWQVRNLGFGTRAARNEVASQQRQAQIDLFRVRDLIIAEVTTAHAEVKARKRQVGLARQRVEKALDAHKRSLSRIRGFVGVPLEALQDVQALIVARQELVNATVSYNQAQFRLLRSIGRTAVHQ